ncbi:MAG: hypothetical protein HN948_06995 [Clostridia bacterium]|nr:hypothetical protein [Clostridia bacterium]MBT7122739.1 hypothetical protein [Clostridia bacterium]
MNESQIKQLIKRIVEEVLIRLSGFGGYKTLALMSDMSAHMSEACEYLVGKSALAAIFGEAQEPADIDSRRVDTDEDKRNLLTAMRSANEVVLVAPSLTRLCAVANGEECCFAATVFEKAILNGKKTTVLLDFVPPKFKRGTLFEKAINAVDALRDMGVTVVYLNAKADEGYALVTEFEINEAAKRGIERIKCAPGAIITPLARDAAKDKGIAIDI